MNGACELEFFRQIFEKYSNIKFHENPFIGSRVVPGGRMDKRKGGQQTDMTKLIVAFPNFADEPKKWLELFEIRVKCVKIEK